MMLEIEEATVERLRAMLKMIAYFIDQGKSEMARSLALDMCGALDGRVQRVRQ